MSTPTESLVVLLDAALTAITLAETLDQAQGIAHAALHREVYDPAAASGPKEDA